MKNFIMKHPMMFNVSISGFFLLLSIFLAILLDNLWFLLFLVPAVLVLVEGMIFKIDYEERKDCPNCNYSTFEQKEKYCGYCGYAMKIRKKIRAFKICPNGHRHQITDKFYYLNEFCSECGAPFCENKEERDEK